MSEPTRAVVGHFATARAARTAYVRLRRAQLLRPEMKVLVRTPTKGQQELPLSCTDVRGATLRGAIFGALVGMAGAIAWSVMDAGTGFDALLVGAGALGGLLLGTFAGALMGPMEPHPDLAVVESSGAGLIVESPDPRDLAWATQFFRRRDVLVAPSPPEPPAPRAHQASMAP